MLAAEEGPQKRIEFTAATVEIKAGCMVNELVRETKRRLSLHMVAIPATVAERHIPGS